MCECQGDPLARVTLALGLPYLLVNRALEILTFFYYANYISDDVILFATKNGKILSKQYLWKY